jgi:hypothetical protein
VSNLCWWFWDCRIVPGNFNLEWIRHLSAHSIMIHGFSWTITLPHAWSSCGAFGGTHM